MGKAVVVKLRARRLRRALENCILVDFFFLRPFYPVGKIGSAKMVRMMRMIIILSGTQLYISKNCLRLTRGLVHIWRFFFLSHDAHKLVAYSSELPAYFIFSVLFGQIHDVSLTS